MRNKEVSNREIDLLDFLAEAFLQKGKSISYTDLNGLPALAVETEGHEPETFISFPPEAHSSVLTKIESKQKLTISVATKEEEQKLLRELQRLKLHKVNIYRLSEQECSAFVKAFQN